MSKDAASAAVAPPPGVYRYEIRRGPELIAIETATLKPGALSAARVSTDGASRHEVEAALAPDLGVIRVAVRYRRGPFERAATYESDGENLRGSLSAVGGRTAVIAKLGRFGEVDAQFILFNALIIARVRARGQERFTGRVAVIDAATLMASSPKQIYRPRDGARRLWLLEPRMGEREEFELDEAGRIIGRADARGLVTILS